MQSYMDNLSLHHGKMWLYYFSLDRTKYGSNQAFSNHTYGYKGLARILVGCTQSLRSSYKDILNDEKPDFAEVLAQT